jgi:hypothetical protein
MQPQDEVDTVPIVLNDATHVTFESIELSPGDRAEIVLSPETALRCPILFLSCTPKEGVIAVEQIIHGRTAIFEKPPTTLDQLRFGKPTGLTVTESEPIKVIVTNTGSVKTTIGASLVANNSKE